MSKNLKKITILILIVVITTFKCGPREDINITVTSGITPVYAWDGGPVNKLIVRKAEGGVAVWAIKTPEKDGIKSPVTHGSIPEGCVLILNPEAIGSPIDTTAYEKPLESGIKYKIGIIRVFSGNVFGEKIFK